MTTKGFLLTEKWTVRKAGAEERSASRREERGFSPGAPQSRLAQDHAHVAAEIRERVGGFARRVCDGVRRWLPHRRRTFHKTENDL